MARAPVKRRAPPPRRAASAADNFWTWEHLWPWLASAVPILLIVLFFASGAASRAADSFHRNFADIMADHGFTVQHVQLAGRKEIDRETIMAVVNLDHGTPLFDVDPHKIRAGLEELTWVDSARVERRLPATVYIKITERYPAALWQSQQKLHLIDRTGILLGNKDLDKFKDLPIIIGDDAPKYAGVLLEALNTYPDFKMQVRAATYVGNRRWDLQLRDNTVIKLPEAEPAIGLARLIDFDKEHGVLATPTRAIDLRLPDRVIIQPVADETTAALALKNKKLP